MEKEYLVEVVVKFRTWVDADCASSAKEKLKEIMEEDELLAGNDSCNMKIVDCVEKDDDDFDDDDDYDYEEED